MQIYVELAIAVALALAGALSTAGRFVPIYSTGQASIKCVVLSTLLFHGTPALAAAHARPLGVRLLPALCSFFHKHFAPRSDFAPMAVVATAAAATTKA